MQRVRITWLNDPEEEGFGKHWVKEHLVTSIFYFSHSVFYSITERNRHFSNVWLVVSECFQFWSSLKFCDLVKGWPITRRQILDSAKLNEFADDNFKFKENGRKLSKRVENTVGKGEIARYEQFLLFPQCFQEACFPGASKGVIVWEWVETLYFHRYEEENKLQGDDLDYNTTLFQAAALCAACK